VCNYLKVELKTLEILSGFYIVKKTSYKSKPSIK